MFADRKDKVLLTLGSLAAMGAGCVMPIYSLIYGEIVDQFNEESKAGAEKRDAVNKNVIYFLYLGVTAFACHYVKVKYCLRFAVYFFIHVLSA